MSDRPEQRPEPLNSVSAPAEPASLPEPLPPPVPLPPPNPSRAELAHLRTPHAEKFRAAIAVLVTVAVAAIIIAVIAATGGSTPTTTSSNWSQWAPDAGGKTGVEEIADYVAPFYRLTSSEQLDVVTPISLTSETAAGTTTGSGLTVAVNSSSTSSTGSSSSQSLSLLTGKTVAYNICGEGPADCELAGTPSADRLLLLRREALELALYTLEYEPSTQNVLVVLPPAHTTAASTGSSKTTTSSSASSGTVTLAVLFVRDVLAPWLKVPLSQTLAQNPPAISALPTWSQSDEAGLVDQITARWLFASEVEAQQEGGSVLVLNPLPPQ